MWRSVKPSGVRARHIRARLRAASTRAPLLLQPCMKQGVVRTLVLACALGMATQIAVSVPYEDSPDASASDADYAAGKAAIDKKNWAEAVKRFQQAALRTPDSADLHNYLGFSYRKLGKMDLAFGHYKRSLEANPRHLGAHEYIGEAYLQVGDIASAEKHLAALRSICLLPCEELVDLDKAIKSYRAGEGRAAKQGMKVEAPVARP